MDKGYKCEKAHSALEKHLSLTLIVRMPWHADGSLKMKFKRLIIFFSVLLFLNIVALIYGKEEAHAKKNENENSSVMDLEYVSSVSKDECCLCGTNPDSLLSSYWGQQNVGVINLNTFQFFVFEINQYDDSNNLIDEKVLLSESIGKINWSEGGSTIDYSYSKNRGYFSGRVSMNEDTPLQAEQLKSYVCTDCLNSIIDQLYGDGPYCDIALIDFNKKAIKVLNRNVTGINLSDYYIACHYTGEYSYYDIAGFYSPDRYTKPGLGYYNDSTPIGIVSEYCEFYQIHIDEELMKFLTELVSIDSIHQLENEIEIRGRTSNGLMTGLYLFCNDGTYKIIDYENWVPD